MPERTPEGKWVIWERSTGRRLARWPVDARGMLATGEFTDQSLEGVEAPAPAAPLPAAVSVPDPLPAEHSPGVPLVVTRAHEAAPSHPLEPPVRTKGKRA